MEEGKAMNDRKEQVLFDALDGWISDGYSCDIRYIATGERGSARLLSASVAFYPVAGEKDFTHVASVSGFHFGLDQRIKLGKAELQKVLDLALGGAIRIPDIGVSARLLSPIFVSPLARRNDDLWFQELRHVVRGVANSEPHPLDRELDNQLRLHKIPFDGVQDVVSWLGLADPRDRDWVPHISIVVLPPADIILHESGLSDEQLSLTVVAHSLAERDAINLMVRFSPGAEPTASRLQVAPQLKWEKDALGPWKGKAIIPTSGADAALAVLMTGPDFVRRHWFVDTAKSRNVRFVEMQVYDRELRQLKRCLANPMEKDSVRFERAVACVLFLKGYSSTLPVETDAPDILSVTPGGQILIVECTVRVSDVHSKLGKLVDRRLALTKALEASGHPREVTSVLVCSMPRANIALSDNDFKEQKVLLVAHEDILTQLDSLHFLIDPDQELNNAKQNYLS